MSLFFFLILALLVLAAVTLVLLAEGVLGRSLAERTWVKTWLSNWPSRAPSQYAGKRPESHREALPEQIAINQRRQEQQQLARQLKLQRRLERQEQLIAAQQQQITAQQQQIAELLHRQPSSSDALALAALALAKASEQARQEHQSLERQRYVLHQQQATMELQQRALARMVAELQQAQHQQTAKPQAVQAGSWNVYRKQPARAPSNGTTRATAIVHGLGGPLDEDYEAPSDDHSPYRRGFRYH